MRCTCGTVAYLYPFLQPPKQTAVEVPTSYADSGVYKFSRVFPANSPLNDVFVATLPIIMDCMHGVNGAILVRDKHL